MPTILFFGDSLTAGYGLSNPANQSFPSLIGDKINALGLRYEVVNAGVSGDTTQGGLSRLDYWLNRSIDVFVLELGINDIMRGISTASIQKNLSLIIDKVRAKYPKVRIALMGMQIPKVMAIRPVEEFHQVYSNVASEYKVTLMPSFLQGVIGVWSLNLGDGMHPSAEGYKVIANNAWTFIRPLIG